MTSPAPVLSPGTPPPPVTPPAALSYANAPPSNRPAAASLLCGLLLFVPFVTGILALVYARRGLRRAEEVGGVGAAMARAGLILGVLNLSLSLVAAASAPVAMTRARQKALAVRCMSQMRQLSVAAIMYGNANSGALPQDLDALGPMLGPGALPALCSCPEATALGTPAAAALKSGTPCSYVYLPPPPGVTRIAQLRNPAATPMAFEPLANHGGRGFGVVYWDGHAEWHEGPAAQALAVQLNKLAAATRTTATTAPVPPGPE